MDMTLNSVSEQELHDMFKEGKTLYQISRKFNTTIKELFKLGRSYGIHFAYDHNHIPYPNKQDLESMYTDEGMTQKQISREFDVDQGTVGRWIRNRNIPTRGPGGSTGAPMPPKEVLSRMYTKECMVIYQISREFGVADSTVSGWLQYYTIPTRGSKGTLAVPMPSKEVLEKMYSEECMDQYQISLEFGVTDVTVSNWLHKFNISTRGSRGTIDNVPPEDELLNHISDGLNQHHIAEKYGVCDSTIFRWCECYGIHGMVNGFRCHTPEHINWRDAVFDRDHYTCQKCGATNTYIQAHHIVPFADHPEVAYELENGITLCKRCHESIRQHEYEYIDYFAAITQPHLREHEVIESMHWEAPLPPLQPNTLFPQEILA